MFGPNELIIIGLIIVLLFGASKLPELARSLGRSQAEFRKAQIEAEREVREIEKKLNESKSDSEKLRELADSLGIDVKDKTDDELLDEIRDRLKLLKP